MRVEEYDGISVAVFEGGDRAVLIIHGFMASKRSMYPLAEAINSRGYTVYVPDLWGHGESEGDFREFTTTKAILSVKKVLKRIREGSIAVIGYSLGGQVALHVKDERIKTKILLAPAIDIPAVFTPDERKEWRKTNRLISPRLGMVADLDYEFIRDAEAICSRIPKQVCPVLIIHGRRDSIVPVEQSRRFAEERGIRLIETDNDHDDLLTEESLREIIEELDEKI